MPEFYPPRLIVGQLRDGLFALFFRRGNSAAVFYCGYCLYRSMALAYARPLPIPMDASVLLFPKIRAAVDQS